MARFGILERRIDQMEAEAENIVLVSSNRWTNSCQPADDEISEQLALRRQNEAR